ncbi:hypothetical protein T4A_872 [Trichinella pseudospiralis]|uniref:Uncharacterized protein n=1 Tax=Trichinella pseudospiralis TaxID=6337 RepID=A0A0V1EK17_TRIPS|nr:hypothetical protein T4A_872 [Trichinella pseudospiralis]KRY90451.1 hypothetical protein T4D_6773 [Trichinella pseudospiralis]
MALIGPTSVRDQIAQDLFQELEINYLKLRISQNTRAKHSVQMYNLLIFRYGLDDTNSIGHLSQISY